MKARLVLYWICLEKKNLEVLLNLFLLELLLLELSVLLLCWNSVKWSVRKSFHLLSLENQREDSPDTAAAKSLSRVRLCNPIDGSPPGSPVPGILQARTLAWVAISFCNAWKWKVKGKSRSPVRLFAAPWTAAYQAPPSLGFSRQEYWSGMLSPSPSPDITSPHFW